jgi:hypothetical protein
MEEEMLTSIGLAASGFGGGDPDAIMRMPVRTVIGMIHYSTFQQQYLETKNHMQREDSKL